jgi:hypothetical protein
MLLAMGCPRALKPLREDPGTPTYRTGASSKKNTIHDPLWGEYLLVLNLGNFRE